MSTNTRPYRCPFCKSTEVVYMASGYAVHQLHGLTDDGALQIYASWTPNIDSIHTTLHCTACDEYHEAPTYLREEFVECTI
jgi:hypothetical protein